MSKPSEHSPPKPTLPPRSREHQGSERDPRAVALDEWLALQTLVDSLADAKARGKPAPPPAGPVTPPPRPAALTRTTDAGD